MIDAVQDVMKAERDEAQRRLMPTRIEANEPRIADVLVRALTAVRREEAQHGRRANAEARERRVEREARRRRGDRIVDRDIEERLLPEERRRRVGWRARDV